jgi:hypothetical protein
METVTLQVAAGGESPTPPEACRGIIVGPGVNQPEAYPGYGGFVGWESPLRRRDGTWLVAFSAGYWHASPPTPLRFPAATVAEYARLGMPVDIDAPTGGRAMIVRSADEGRRWSRPATLIDTPADDRHPSLLELPSGVLVSSLFSYASGDPDAQCHVYVVRSLDGGVSWEQQPRLLPTPFVAEETDGPLQLQPDGSVLMIVDGQRQRGGRWEVGVFRGVDEGQRWSLVGGYQADHDLFEPSLARLPDGRLVAIARPEGAICWSADDGRTWTPPVTFGLRLFAPSLYVLADGTLVCLHGSYCPGAPGLRLVFSRDGGRTWVGAGPGHGFLVDQAYGYGKAMELPDGSLFVVYLSTGGHHADDAQSNAIRCVRVRLRSDYQGIELLPAPNAPGAVL